MKVARIMLGMTFALSASSACSSKLDTHGSSAQRDSAEHLGSLGLTLQPVSGISVNSVHYVVTSGSPIAVPAPAVIAEGNLPTPGTASGLGFGVPLPVGSDYFISLSGASAEPNDDITCTGSFGPFAITANSSTPFDMTLTCVDNTNGQLLTTVDVNTDACPRLIVDYAVAEPGEADVGGSIDLHSIAHDLDNPAEVISYAWSIVDPAMAGVGSFTPVNAHDASFHCAAPGFAVAIKVTATNHQCSKALQTLISCVNFDFCGNGVVEPEQGEVCDPAAGPGHPADPTCPSDCVKICGDGIAEGDEQCDPLPLNPAVCIPPGAPGQCTLRPHVCGDGFVNGTEACDPLGNVGPNQVPLPSGIVCAPGCGSIGVAGPCGDGITSGAEQCDAGTGTSAAPSRTCADNCKLISTDACVACEQAGICFASSDNCLGPAARPFTLAQRLACFAVIECIRGSNCLDGTGSLGSCYCGTLDTGTCGSAPFDLALPGAPNGPCAAVMQQGNAASVMSPGTVPVTSNAAILGALTSKARPTGQAGQRLFCDKSDPVCAPLCGVQ